MLDQEHLKHAIAVLRQAARSSAVPTPSRLLEEIEGVAGERLRDLPPPTWDENTKFTYERLGRRLPNAEWDLGRIYDNHGLGDLVETLRRRLEAVKKGSGATREQKRLLRWHPAAAVLRYCAEIRERGPNPMNVEWLIDALRDMMGLEEQIGRKMRETSTGTRGPTPETRRIVAAMARHMANPRISQRRAAEMTCKGGLGTSADANLKAWKRWSKNLGHQD